jgi:lycopene cyclase domain-containing protein
VEHLTYLALLVGCLVVTAPLEIVLRVRVYARWRRLLLALVPEFVVFVAWVLYAIAAGHWDYSAARTLDVRLPGGIPVEEVLFFLVVPLCAVLALEAVRKVTGWDAGYPNADDGRGSIAARNERGADRGAESAVSGADDGRGSIAAISTEEGE